MKKEPPSAPLTPPDCDLRRHAAMPLDVLWFRESDVACLADAEAFRAAVMLWCASWHQVPAASLPDDDDALCRAAGYGRDMKTWLRVKDAALTGFVPCWDGRLYHPRIVAIALETWRRNQSYRERGRAGCKARWGSRS